MGLSPHSWRREAELRFLESLRGRFEREGFTYTVEPDVRCLPDFLGSYRPDALAQRPGMNVAIEVLAAPGTEARRRLMDIGNLFRGRSDWRFEVANVGGGPLDHLAIPAPARRELEARLHGLAELAERGERRAAFVLAWPLLEAALRSVGGEGAGQPRSPEAVVQALSMNGHLDLGTERRLWPLVEMWNRIVHGDLEAEPMADDVDVVLGAVEEALIEAEAVA